MDNGLKKFEKSSPIEYFLSILVISFVLIFAIILSVSAIFLLNSFDNVRCWVALGNVPEDGVTIVQLATGRGVGGHGFLDFAVEYNIPLTEGNIERVQIHGPMKLGVDTDPTPIAYTICGVDVDCQDLETETCLREDKPSGCGRIANKARSLGTNDVPVVENGRLIHLANMLGNNPQSFYVNVTSNTHPNGLHRAYIGSICKL